MRHEFWWGCRTSLENPNARQSDGIYKNNLQQLKKAQKNTKPNTHIIFFFFHWIEKSLIFPKIESH